MLRVRHVVLIGLSLVAAGCGFSVGCGVDRDPPPTLHAPWRIVTP